MPEPETRTAIGKLAHRPGFGLRSASVDYGKLLERVLAVRVLGPLERVLAGEAGVAVHRSRREPIAS